MFTVLKSASLLEKEPHRLMAVKTGTQNPLRRFWLVGVPKTSVQRNGRSVEPWTCPLFGFRSFRACDELKKVNLRSIQF